MSWQIPVVWYILSWGSDFSKVIDLSFFTKLQSRNIDKYNLGFRLFPVTSVFGKHSESIDILYFSFSFSPSSRWWLGEIVCSGHWINRYLLVWVCDGFPFKISHRVYFLAIVFLTPLECLKSISPLTLFNQFKCLRDTW